MPTLAEILAKKATQPGPSKPSGLKITPETERAAKAAEFKAAFDATAPKVSPPAPRELGAPEQGEQIPMEHPPQDASEEERVWFTALHAFESSLCVVIEPGPDHLAPAAWIACESSPHRPPILLFKLPLLNRTLSGNPF